MGCVTLGAGGAYSTYSACAAGNPACPTGSVRFVDACEDISSELPSASGRPARQVSLTIG